MRLQAFQLLGLETTIREQMKKEFLLHFYWLLELQLFLILWEYLSVF